MNRRRGISLVEALVSLGLLAAVSSLTVTAFLRGSPTLKSEVAEVLSSEIRSLQQRSIQENKYIALTLKGPNTTQLGVEVGHSTPKLERVRDFSSDFKGCWLNAEPPTQFTSPDARLSDTWFSGQRTALIFTPTGKIYSNLPLQADGGYHLKLVRSHGGRWDIRLDPSGNFAFQEDFSGNSAPVSLNLNHKLGLTSNGAPQITHLSVMTSAAHLQDPDGVIRLNPNPEQLFTFRLEALDDDGDEQLFIRGQGPGHFSSAQASPMRYQADLRRWVGWLTWQAPATLASGAQLEFFVNDRSGSVAMAADSSLHKVRLKESNPARIILAAQLDSDSRNRIYQVNPDGTGLIPLLPDDRHRAGPSLSPDRSLIAFWSWTSWPPSLCVSGIDGSNIQTLASNFQSGSSEGHLLWSADSSRIFVGHDSKQLRSYPVGGGAFSVLTSDTYCRALVKSPDHSKLAYFRPNGMGPGRIEIINLNSNLKSIVAQEAAGLKLLGNSGESPITFSGDSNTLLFCQATNYGAPSTIMSYSGTGPATAVFNSGKPITWLRAGPDRKLAFIAQAKLYSVADYTDPTTVKLIAQRNTGNSYYAGSPDRCELSRDGNTIYWMQGKGGDSHLVAYNFNGSGEVKLCKTGSYYQSSDSNGFCLFEP